MDGRSVDAPLADGRRTARLRGTIIPATTPFDARESLDLAGLEANFARWADTDVVGYMVLGSNGEFRSLSDKESSQVVRQAAALKGDKTLIAGVGRDSLHHTLEFLASLNLNGVDYVSVLTPHYFGTAMNGAALARYYTAVADAVAVPVLIYVAPGFANGVLVPPATLRQLADHPNIAGIKDTSSTSMVDYMLTVGIRDDFEVLAGSLDTIMTTLSFGGAGGVLSAANYVPRQCARLTTLWSTGAHSAAFAYYARLRNLVKATGGVLGVAGVKACMDVLGYAGGAPRQPVAALTDSDRTRLLETFENELSLLDQAAG
jgi:4-hydroxy-2-oxoglutarate aldolase